MQETDPYEPLDAADHTAYQPPAEPSYGWLLLRGFCTSAVLRMWFLGRLEYRCM